MWLRELPALAEDLGSIPNIHIAAHTMLLWPLPGPGPHMVQANLITRKVIFKLKKIQHCFHSLQRMFNNWQLGLFGTLFLFYFIEGPPRCFL